MDRKQSDMQLMWTAGVVRKARGEKAGVGVGLCGDYADSGREIQEQLTVQNTGLGKQYVRKI